MVRRRVGRERDEFTRPHFMKLFVDDLRPAPEGWHWAKTNTEAIRLLATKCVREVSLDHDIRRCSFRKHWTGETFEAVAHYIAAMNEWERPRVRIHTGNTEAGKRMADIIGIPYDYRIYNAEDYQA